MQLAVEERDHLITAQLVETPDEVDRVRAYPGPGHGQRRGIDADLHGRPPAAAGDGAAGSGPAGSGPDSFRVATTQSPTRSQKSSPVA